MDDAELRAFLRAMRDMIEAHPSPGVRPWPYRSAEAFVLAHGRPWPWRPPPADLAWGRPRRCFENAATLAGALPERFGYVEGFASGPMLPLAVQHAWCVDREGFVVDITWRGEGAAYFGVPFRRASLGKVLAERCRLPLIDAYEDRWPLLTGEDAAEEAVLQGAWA